jgi:hypothetical protein
VEVGASSVDMCCNMRRVSEALVDDNVCVKRLVISVAEEGSFSPISGHSVHMDAIEQHSPVCRTSRLAQLLCRFKNVYFLTAYVIRAAIKCKANEAGQQCGILKCMILAA